MPTHPRSFAGRPSVRPVVPPVLATRVGERPELRPIANADGLDPWLAPPPIDGAAGPQAPHPPHAPQLDD